MLYSPKLFIQERLVVGSLSLALLSILISWWYVARAIHPTGELIFLHYDIIFGVNLIGEWWKAYIPSMVGTVFLLINGLIAWFLYGDYRVISRIILVFTSVISFAVLFGQMLLVNINS